MSENLKKPIVTIEMEDGGIINLELYPSKAPETVNTAVNSLLILMPHVATISKCWVTIDR